MSEYVGIPISAAKEISERFEKDQVIIVTWDRTHEQMHVTTYGKSLDDSAQAALGGNFVKRALGFSEDLCNSIPGRVEQ